MNNGVYKGFYWLHFIRKKSIFLLMNGSNLNLPTDAITKFSEQKRDKSNQSCITKNYKSKRQLCMIL